jgi:hypothetical protein
MRKYYRVFQLIHATFALILLPILKIVWEPDNSYVDEWGTRWTKPDSSHYFDPVPPFPLESADIKDIDRHNWPDPDDPGRYVGLKERAKPVSKYLWIIQTWLRKQ